MIPATALDALLLLAEDGLDRAIVRSWFDARPLSLAELGRRYEVSRQAAHERQRRLVLKAKTRGLWKELPPEKRQRSA